MFGCVPCGVVEGLAEPEIEGQLRDYPPSERKVGSASKTVDRRNGVGVEDIVLVGVNTIVPLTGIEELQTEMQRERVGHVESHVLEDGDTVGDRRGNEISLYGSAKSPRTGTDIELCA